MQVNGGAAEIIGPSTSGMSDKPVSPLHQQMKDLERKIQRFTAGCRLNILDYHHKLGNGGPKSARTNKSSDDTDSRVTKPPSLSLDNVALRKDPKCFTNPLPRRERPTLPSSYRDIPPSSSRKQYCPAWETMETKRQSDSAEVFRRLHDIEQKSGQLCFENGKCYHSVAADMEPLGELGHGTCGSVMRMKHKQTDRLIAVKQLRRSGDREESKRVLMDLDVVLRSNECPYIVRCYGCFITTAEVWICMEMMATCFEKLKNRLQCGIPERILGKTSVAVLEALNYLKESHDIMHRDIKPSNILLDRNGAIKLCDFGISGRLVDSKAKTRGAGCAAYMSPERIDPPDKSRPQYDIRADVWSLGISMVELARGRFPYASCRNDFEVLTTVLQEDPPQLGADEGFTNEFRDFVQQCLIKDYTFRPKYKDLLRHPFIQHYYSAPVDVAEWFASSIPGGTCSLSAEQSDSDKDLTPK